MPTFSPVASPTLREWTPLFTSENTLALMKSMMLWPWHGLSDVAEEAIDLDFKKAELDGVMHLVLLESTQSSRIHRYMHS